MKKKIVSLAAAAMFLSVMVSSAAFAETVDAIAKDAIVDIIAEETGKALSVKKLNEKKTDPTTESVSEETDVEETDVEETDVEETDEGKETETEK